MNSSLAHGPLHGQQGRVFLYGSIIGVIVMIAMALLYVGTYKGAQAPIGATQHKMQQISKAIQFFKLKYPDSSIIDTTKPHHTESGNQLQGIWFDINRSKLKGMLVDATDVFKDYYGNQIVILSRPHKASGTPSYPTPGIIIVGDEEFYIYSVGPNAHDDGGIGDDILLNLSE